MALELTPLSLARVLMLGFYVLGGELAWIVRKTISHWSSCDKDALLWRNKQIARRKTLFSLHEQESA